MSAWLEVMVLCSMAMGRLIAYLDGTEHDSRFSCHRFPYSIVYGSGCRNCRDRVPTARSLP